MRDKVDVIQKTKKITPKPPPSRVINLHESKKMD